MVSIYAAYIIFIYGLNVTIDIYGTYMEVGYGSYMEIKYGSYMEFNYGSYMEIEYGPYILYYQYY